MIVNLSGDKTCNTCRKSISDWIEYRGGIFCIECLDWVNRECPDCEALIIHVENHHFVNTGIECPRCGYNMCPNCMGDEICHYCEGRDDR